jgi:hypothetical protein
LIAGIDPYNASYALQFAKSARKEIRIAALELICKKNDEIYEFSPRYWNLDFGHVMSITIDPKLIVQSEERLLEATLWIEKWIEKSRCTEVQDDLKLRYQLDESINSIQASLGELLENA